MRKHHLRALLTLFAGCLLLPTGGPVAQVAKEGKPASGPTGVLLMAHGGSKEWNDQVLDIVSQINATVPAEVALGMADRSTLQAGTDKLVARGVKQIVAVPLFVSSHSGVFDSLAYLLGVRAAPPADLDRFTSMGHDMKDGKQAQTSSSLQPSDQAKPVNSPVPIRMTEALDRHRIVADILLDRASAISRDPRHEVVILVAHGPQGEAENTLWLKDMASLARQIGARRAFSRIEYLTLRDDADDPIRNQATEDLRRHVEAAGRKNQRALIVPVLLSYGGIDGGLRKRLDGLHHTMSPQGILPDSRIVQWVLNSVHESEGLLVQKGGS